MTTLNFSIVELLQESISTRCDWCDTRTTHPSRPIGIRYTYFTTSNLAVNNLPQTPSFGHNFSVLDLVFKAIDSCKRSTASCVKKISGGWNGQIGPRTWPVLFPRMWWHISPEVWLDSWMTRESSVVCRQPSLSSEFWFHAVSIIPFDGLEPTSIKQTAS